MARSQNIKIKIGGFETIRRLPNPGGQGIVYVARCIEPQFDGLDRGATVALKVMTADDPDGKLLHRLEKRTEALVKIVHPNIVRYYGCFVEESDFHSSYVVVMDYLQGDSLNEVMLRVENKRGLDADLAIKIIRECLSALLFATQHGIIHRDIKPGNIFVCVDGTTKLIDFEVARQENSGSTVSTQGNLHGSFDYMAPDFLDPAFRGDEQSDIFSLAVCFYEALTGSIPYQQVSGDINQAHFVFYNRWNPSGDSGSAEVIKIKGHACRLVRHSKGILQKGLARERAKRFASFADFETAFCSVRAHEIKSPKSRYQLLNTVGKGGFGCVYKARRVSDNQLVAIKYLLKPEYSKRFILEAKLLEAFDSSRIVRFIEFFQEKGVDGDNNFIVMNYLSGMPGSSLSDRLRLHKKGLPFQEVIQGFVRFAEGLAVLHASHVYHRDIKPSNLYFPENRPGDSCIIDMGVSRDAKGSLTHGRVPGTLDYMPPEVVTGNYRGDAGMDIYALGLCLYEAISAKKALPRLPVGDAAVPAFMERAKAKQAPVFNDPFVVENDQLLTLLQYMTDPDCNKREQDASNVAKMLVELLDTESAEFDLSPTLSDDNGATAATHVASPDEEKRLFDLHGTELTRFASGAEPEQDDPDTSPGPETVVTYAASPEDEEKLRKLREPEMPDFGLLENEAEPVDPGGSPETQFLSPKDFLNPGQSSPPVLEKPPLDKSQKSPESVDQKKPGRVVKEQKRPLKTEQPSPSEVKPTTADATPKVSESAGITDVDRSHSGTKPSGSASSSGGGPSSRTNVEKTPRRENYFSLRQAAVLFLCMTLGGLVVTGWFYRPEITNWFNSRERDRVYELAMDKARNELDKISTAVSIDSFVELTNMVTSTKGVRKGELFSFTNDVSPDVATERSSEIKGILAEYDTRLYNLTMNAESKAADILAVTETAYQGKYRISLKNGDENRRKWERWANLIGVQQKEMKELDQKRVACVYRISKWELDLIVSDFMKETDEGLTAGKQKAAEWDSWAKTNSVILNMAVIEKEMNASRANCVQALSTNRVELILEQYRLGTSDGLESGIGLQDKWEEWSADIGKEFYNTEKGSLELASFKKDIKAARSACIEKVSDVRVAQAVNEYELGTEAGLIGGDVLDERRKKWLAEVKASPDLAKAPEIDLAKEKCNTSILAEKKRIEDERLRAEAERLAKEKTLEEKRLHAKAVELAKMTLTQTVVQVKNVIAGNDPFIINKNLSALTNAVAKATPDTGIDLSDAKKLVVEGKARVELLTTPVDLKIAKCDYPVIARWSYDKKKISNELDLSKGTTVAPRKEVYVLLDRSDYELYSTNCTAVAGKPIKVIPPADDIWVPLPALTALTNLIAKVKGRNWVLAKDVIDKNPSPVFSERAKNGSIWNGQVKEVLLALRLKSNIVAFTRDLNDCRKKHERKSDNAMSFPADPEDPLVLKDDEVKRACAALGNSVTNWFCSVACAQEPLETRFERLNKAGDFLGEIDKINYIAGGAFKKVLRDKLNSEKSTFVLVVSNQSLRDMRFAVGENKEKLLAKNGITTNRLSATGASVRIVASAEKCEAQKKEITLNNGGYHSVVFEEFIFVPGVLRLKNEIALKPAPLFSLKRDGRKVVIGNMTLPVGTYTLACERSDYKSLPQEFEIRAGETTEMDVAGFKWDPKTDLLALQNVEKAWQDQKFGEAANNFPVSWTPIDIDDHTKRKNVLRDKICNYYAKIARQYVDMRIEWLFEKERYENQVVDLKMNETKKDKNDPLPEEPKEEKPNIEGWVFETFDGALKKEWNMDEEERKGLLKQLFEYSKDAHFRVHEAIKYETLFPDEAINELAKAVDNKYPPNLYDIKIVEFLIKRCRDENNSRKKRIKEAIASGANPKKIARYKAEQKIAQDDLDIAENAVTRINSAYKPKPAEPEPN